MPTGSKVTVTATDDRSLANSRVVFDGDGGEPARVNLDRRSAGGRGNGEPVRPRACTRLPSVGPPKPAINTRMHDDRARPPPHRPYTQLNGERSSRAAWIRRNTDDGTDRASDNSTQESRIDRSRGGCAARARRSSQADQGGTSHDHRLATRLGARDCSPGRVAVKSATGSDGTERLSDPVGKAAKANESGPTASSGIERKRLIHHWEQGVAGSNPAAPTGGSGLHIGDFVSGQ